MAVGTLTVTKTSLVGQAMLKYSMVWVSDASGDVNTNNFEMIRGAVFSVKFVPSTSAVPTASYDVSLTDQDGADLLQGAGSDLSATVPTTTPFASRPVLDHASGEKVDLVVTNAGNAKGGTVVVIVGPATF